MLNGKKILIENCAGLGDLIMFTPALRRIKELYPECQITFLTKNENMDILKGLPYIDKVYSIQRKEFLGRFRCIPALWDQDYVIFTTWQPQLAWIAYLFGIPNRISIYKKKYEKTNLFHRYIKTWVLDTKQYAASIVSYGLELALQTKLNVDILKLDIPSVPTPTISRVDDLLRNVGILPSDKYIIIPPFTGLNEKNWPVSSLNEFVDKVKEKYNLPCVIIGPKSKLEESKQLNNVINLIGETNLFEVIEIIKRSVLFVGPDSGPMHIAGALEKPSIPLFSKYLPSQWAPKKKCFPVTLNLPCSPCSDECARQCDTLQCIRGITAGMIFAEVKKVIEKEIIEVC